MVKKLSTNNLFSIGILGENGENYSTFGLAGIAANIRHHSRIQSAINETRDLT